VGLEIILEPGLHGFGIAILEIGLCFADINSLFLKGIDEGFGCFRICRTGKRLNRSPPIRPIEQEVRRHV
jgi:hypothetical protein